MLHPARMIFTTQWFLVFLLAAVGGYWALPGRAARLGWLMAAGAVFHWKFAGPAGVWPILGLMTVTFLAGRSRRPGWCLAAMALCGAALVFYKYVYFLIGSLVTPLDAATGKYLVHEARRHLPAAPPLAISFFVFEFVHYLSEVRRGGEPIRHAGRFFAFAIFFPSLVAGPIKRYQQFLPELATALRERAPLARLAEGGRRIGLGFFKKVVLADNLTLYIEATQPHYFETGLGERWLVFLALAARILFDFSGYSDIAIGCGQLLGIRLPENFHWPYAARSLQDFWQRWHISLSSWIRDYVYIPLGGNRHGPARRALNGFVALALCGLWHGPAWHFVAWGLFHGGGLAAGAVYGRIPGIRAVRTVLDREPLAGWALTQGYVCLGWLLFFYPVREAVRMAEGLVVR